MTVPAAEIHVGDFGTVFELTFYDENNNILDVSGTTSQKFYFAKPDRTTVLTVTPSFTNTGTDGKLRYTTVASDVDQAGLWELQGFVAFSNGQWYSTRTRFRVVGNLV